jgi:hypothetical protein
MDLTDDNYLNNKQISNTSKEVVEKWRKFIQKEEAKKKAKIQQN